MLLSLLTIRSVEMKGGGEAGPKVRVRITLLDGTQACFVGLEPNRNIKASEKNGVVRYDIEFVNFVPGAWDEP